MEPTQSSTRRSWLERAIQGLGGLIAIVLGGSAGAYLLGGKGARARKGWIDAAGFDSLEPNAPQEVVFRRTRVDGWRLASEKQTAWLVRLNDAEVAAFLPQCTHLGCAYHFDERKKQFLCPCHTSNFALDGRVLGGPAPRPLDRYEVRIEGGRVLIGGAAPAKKES